MLVITEENMIYKNSKDAFFFTSLPPRIFYEEFGASSHLPPSDDFYETLGYFSHQPPSGREGDRDSGGRSKRLIKI